MIGDLSGKKLLKLFQETQDHIPLKKLIPKDLRYLI